MKNSALKRGIPYACPFIDGVLKAVKYKDRYLYSDIAGELETVRGIADSLRCMCDEALAQVEDLQDKLDAAERELDKVLEHIKERERGPLGGYRW